MIVIEKGYKMKIECRKKEKLNNIEINKITLFKLIMIVMTYHKILSQLVLQGLSHITASLAMRHCLTNMKHVDGSDPKACVQMSINMLDFEKKQVALEYKSPDWPTSDYIEGCQ